MACIAQGDVQYEDGFDSWTEMVDAISGADNVPIVRAHDYQGHIGKISDFELDHVNKLVKAHFNGKINYDDAISVQWGCDEEGHIKTINHVAIGDFDPMCPKSTCNIERNRNKEGDNKMNEGQVPPPVEVAEDNADVEPNEPAPNYKALYEDLNTRVASYEANMDKFNQFLSILEEEDAQEEIVEIKEKEDIKQEVEIRAPDKGLSGWENHNNITNNTKQLFDKPHYK